MLSEEDIDTFWERVDKKRAEFWKEFFDKHFKANSTPMMPLGAPTEARGEFNGGESWGSSSKEQNA